MNPGSLGVGQSSGGDNDGGNAFASLVLPVLQAGFPSPADDHLQGPLDLNELMVRNPPATFFVRAAGGSMVGAGISDGDLLVVDRSLCGRDGSIIVARVDDEFTVKRLRLHGGSAALEPAAEGFPTLRIDGERDFEVWGVVTHVIHFCAGRLPRPEGEA